MSSGAASQISMRERPLVTPRSSLASPNRRRTDRCSCDQRPRSKEELYCGATNRRSPRVRGRCRSVDDPGQQATVPVTIWWVVGGGIEASLTTLITAPLYATVPFLARRAPLLARAATPTIGLADTLLATKVFGRGSGTELFLFACGLLAALSFRPQEVWWARGLIGLIFAAFIAMRLSGDSALHPLPPDQLGRLLDVNIFSAASLFAFIGLRFAGAN